MSTHTHLKNSFSLKYPLSKLLYILPLAFTLLSQTVSIGNAAETDSLLGKGDPINSSSPRRDSGDVVITVIPEITVEEKFLALPNKERAQKQYTVIKDYITLANEPATSMLAFEALSKKYELQAAFGTREELLKYLKEESVKALSEAPSLAAYLKERREQSEALIGYVERFQETDRSLRAELDRVTDLYQEQRAALQRPG